MPALPSQPLVWIDCEMTGLDPDTDVILEIFCLITDGQLNPAKRISSSDAAGHSHSAGDGDEEDDPGWGTIVHVDKARLDQMDAWCTDHHGRSGLTKAVLESTTTAEQAADGLLAYICQFIPKAGMGLLAGSSVHADKAFLRQAPYDRVTKHLHYRILDVSSIKEAAKRWAPPAPSVPSSSAPGKEGGGKKKGKKPPRKEGAHRAREDILDSIAEARYYKELFFGGQAEGEQA